MDFIDFKTSSNDTDRRFDTLLRKFLPQMPLSLIFKNIRTGFIRLNNKKAKQETKIQAGDIINIEKRLFEKFSSSTDFSNSDSTNNTDKNSVSEENIKKNKDFINEITLFKNQNILILDKPYNMNVQDSKNDKNSLDKIVKSIYIKDSLTFVPGPMHRLDKLTTGIICFSQNLQCARWFSEQISNHSIQKYYLAILEGKLLEKQEWIDYLEKENESSKNGMHKSKLSSALDGDTEGKKAITIIEPISYGKYKNMDMTFAKIFIPTGRNHQIRLQCSSRGYPILQDSLYNSRISKEKNVFEQNLYLHCYKLIFPSNNFDIPLEVNSPIPKTFENALKKILARNYISSL
jgi:23S rRNA pseudouridine955/2504/2580 synthase